MSNMLGRSAPQEETRSLPKGELIGSYNSYLDAQKVVDYLADQQFKVQHVSIIGNNLKSVERVTGRLSYPRVALAGAATGAWFGLFVGIILSLFSTGDTAVSIATSMGLGAAFWMLFGVITYAFQRGKRDFTSTSQVLATSYDVICATDLVNEARRLLQQLPMQQGQAVPAEPLTPSRMQQAPERPQGWADPYAGQPAPRSSEEGAGQQEEGRRVVRPGEYPDLPDGRPQFGVRLPENRPAGAGQAPDGGAPEEDAPRP